MWVESWAICHEPGIFVSGFFSFINSGAHERPGTRLLSSCMFAPQPLSSAPSAAPREGSRFLCHFADMEMEKTTEPVAVPSRPRRPRKPSKNNQTKPLGLANHEYSCVLEFILRLSDMSMQRLGTSFHTHYLVKTSLLWNPIIGPVRLSHSCLKIVP